MSAIQDSGGLDETHAPPSEAAAEYDRAGCWSRAVYSFVQPLIIKGVSRPLEHDDLFQVRKNLHCPLTQLQQLHRHEHLILLHCRCRDTIRPGGASGS